MRISYGEEREKGTEETFEQIMTENFPKLMSDNKLWIQESEGIPSMINTKKFIPKHIIFKLQKIKDKENILREAR